MTTAVEIEAYYPTTDKLKALHHIEEFGLFCSFEEFEDIARTLWYEYRKMYPSKSLRAMPQAPKQITSEDITNQMYAEWNKIFGNHDHNSPSDSAIMAAAYNAINAYLEHK